MALSLAAVMRLDCLRGGVDVIPPPASQDRNPVYCTVVMTSYLYKPYCVFCCWTANPPGPCMDYSVGSASPRTLLSQPNGKNRFLSLAWITIIDAAGTLEPIIQTTDSANTAVRCLFSLPFFAPTP